MPDPQFCYHGTNRVNSLKILREGFNIGTWFSTHLEDALEYGGQYVFKVEFQFIPNRNWQFRVWKKVDIDRIRSLIRITINPLFEKVM